MGLTIRESFTDRNHDADLGTTTWWETPHETRGALFAWCRQEYGRCVGSLFRDDARTVWSGWVFRARVPLDDARRVWPPGTYLRETAVELWQDQVTAEPGPTWQRGAA